jgi:hypothetical protein
VDRGTLVMMHRYLVFSDGVPGASGSGKRPLGCVLSGGTGVIGAHWSPA